MEGGLETASLLFVSGYPIGSDTVTLGQHRYGLGIGVDWPTLAKAVATIKVLLKLLPKPNPALSSGKHPVGRHPKLTAAAILTLPLLRFWTLQGNWKAFYNLIEGSCREEFPKLPCYGPE